MDKLKFLKSLSDTYRHEKNKHDPELEESLAKIEADDLKAFHTSFYQPANTVISIVGDFDTGKMRTEIERLFKGWQNTGQVKQLDLNSGLPVLSGNKVLLVDKSDAIDPALFETRQARVRVDAGERVDTT